MKRNPFFNRQRITDPACFFGRKAEVDVLYSAVITHQCRSLVAERKMGKSSLLTYLCHPDTIRKYGLNPDRQIILYFDLEALSSAGIEDFWIEILDRLCARLPEGEYRAAVQHVLDSNDIRFMVVRRLLRKLRDAGYDLALCLDEFETLAHNSRFDPDFYGQLRSLAGELGLVYITASKRSLYELTYENSETLSSPFFNIFSELPLGIFTNEEADNLLKSLTAQEGVQLSQDEMDFARILSGNHPFYLQIAGYHLFDTPGCGQDRDREAYQLIHKRFLAEAEDHYRYLWSQLTATQQLALLRLDQASEPVIRSLKMKNLIKDGVSRPVPFSETFGEFIQRQRSDEDTHTGQPLAARQLSELDAPPSSSDLVGKTLGGYRVVSPIGHGGMAEVYKGYHAPLDRYVALKVLASHFAADPQFNERFQREATSVARLRHPNIVQVFDFGTSGELTFMVMEYVPGPTLKERIRSLRAEGRRTPFDETLVVVRQVAQALDYAHLHGLVHRDVKPANVLLRGEQHAPFTALDEPYAVLTDFGVVKMLEGLQFTATGTTLGTPDYMSPEQARGDDITPASDIYSLGVVAYELIVGQLPFSADTPLAVLLKHMGDKPPRPRLIAPDLPEAVDMVFSRALAKTPNDRFESACALAASLEAAL